MRSVSVRLDDLKTMILNLGFAGENEHTRVTIDSKRMYDQYPHASASLTVQPPEGEAYPAVIERDGDYVIWDITDSVLRTDGDGEFQLSFTEGETVAKSYNGRFRICRSIIATGEIPEGLDDFLTRAGAALTAIPETIDQALEEAKESGEFDGPPGADGRDGRDGADGFSPTASVEKSGSTATITITDKNGTTTAEVSDGRNGQDGRDGSDGAPGADGYSPTAGVTKSGKVATITITDKNGTTTATVSDGEDADPTAIIDDQAGAGDTNKVWSADKTNSLKSAINSKQDAPASGAAAGKVLGLALVDGQLVPVWDGFPVSDVQVNGSSVLSQGVANVPIAGENTFGVLKVYNGTHGLGVWDTGILHTDPASDAQIRAGNNAYKCVNTDSQHKSVFYGLAKVAGADMASSNNAVGVYTEDAKRKITAMLEPQFRLIKEIAITEETNIVYTNTDTNGDSFLLSELIIDFNGMTATGSGAAGILVNGGAGSTGNNSDGCFLAMNGLYNSSAQRRVAHLEVKGGRFFGEAQYQSYGNTYTAKYLESNLNAMGIKECGKIYEVSIGSLNSYKFTAGTIKIYGR